MASTIATYRAEGESFSLLVSLRRAYAARELLLTFAQRDLMVRYRQTLLGVLWAVVPPVTLMVIFTVVFSRLARMPSDGIPYPIFSYSALLPWSFFSSAVTTAAASVVSNGMIISKTTFPRELLPWSAVMTSGVDFLVAGSVFALLAVIYRAPVTPALLWLPALLVVQLLFTAGVALLMAAFNVYYRDVRYALPLLLQIWMYATPIVFPTSAIPAAVRPAYFLLNPMAGLVDGFRRVLARGLAPDPQATALAAGTAVVVFVLCYRLFKRLEREFVDVL